RACFTGIWIESHEHQEALTDLIQLCQQEDWRLASWDIDQGLQLAGETTEVGNTDPLVVIKAVNGLATPDGTAILVLQNFHRFIQSTEIMQALAQQILAGK